MKCAPMLSITVALVIANPSYGAPELTPHTAEYEVSMSVMSGVLSTELRKIPNGYVAHHIVKPSGLSRMITGGTIDVTSEFQKGTDGVKPIRFQATDTIRGAPDVDLTFDWSTNLVKGTVGGESVELQLDGIAHDSISIQYELMHDLLTGDTNGQYTLFDLDQLKIANVLSTGEKLLKARAGTFTAVGIRHQKEGSLRTTTLWCVEELGYLPVVIEQHRKGKLTFRASLVKYTPTQKE